jgi:Flp pilus assembly protein TadG
MESRGRTRAEGGAAAVEMALVLPLLFLLIFGIIEFGFIFNRWITTTHAAREGVRLLALGDPDAESEAEANAPNVGFPINCTGYSNPADATLGTTGDATLDFDEVRMNCQTTYTLHPSLFRLLPIPNSVTLASNAIARQE